MSSPGQRAATIAGALACVTAACQAPEIMSNRPRKRDASEGLDGAGASSARDAGQRDSFFVVAASEVGPVMPPPPAACPGPAKTEPDSCAKLGVMVDPYYA